MDHARFGTTLIGARVPSFGCGSDEHGARLGAQVAILLKRMRDRTRPADDLDSENRILVDVGRRCELGNDVIPIGIHLIGEQHRQ